MLTPPPDRPSMPTIQVVPDSYHEANPLHLIRLVADMLDQLIAVNDRIPWENGHLTRFHSRVAPDISIVDYLIRVVRYTALENSCLLLILVYIDRASRQTSPTDNSESNRGLPPTTETSDPASAPAATRGRSAFTTPLTFHISSLTVHRFLITATVVAAKTICDFYCKNSHYAKVGGITLHEMNSLELELLGALRWKVSAPFETLQQYYISLVARHPAYQLASAVTTRPSTVSSSSPSESHGAPISAGVQAARVPPVPPTIEHANDWNSDSSSDESMAIS
ncbi:Pho80p cyclin [Dimargaris verticillata]|uniref:Pho80p cyclin n=1 Tax=Dimargaris verticillata TaxID=2761393 RepID=A0A9W8AWC7_9FUNG|nr:Pho80p cyclin [Dimargaris verticillata]